MATTIESILTRRNTFDWYASERKLNCLAHIVNLAIEDFMGAVTQTGVTESKQAIWEYDPQLLHPYYKLVYIERKWGGKKEQDDEIANGNPNAVNWHDFAHTVVEQAVSSS